MTHEIDFSGSILLGGVPQWIYVRGKSRKNPIVLFLHGGPGFCESQFAYLYAPVFENNFTIVHWDQRGTNRSYSENISRTSMTMEQLLLDLVELTKFLLSKYAKENLILVGHSFGSMLGLQMIFRFPELVSYYFGLGQTVCGGRGDLLSYDMALAKVKREGLHESLKDLEGLGRPPYDAISDSLFNAIKWMLGGNFSKQIDDLPKLIAAGPENYRPIVDFRKMSKFADSCLRLEAERWELTDQIKNINVPVCLITGSDDLMTPPALAEELIQSGLLCKEKELFIFENCAHWPHHEFPDKVASLMKARCSTI